MEENVDLSTTIAAGSEVAKAASGAEPAAVPPAQPASATPDAGHGAPVAAAKTRRRRTKAQEIEDLRAALAAAQQEAAAARAEAAEHRDRYLRALADQENYKKRIERTYADLGRQHRKDLFLRLLEVFDNLERAVAYERSRSGEAPEPDTRGLVAGLRIIYLQFKELLAREGLSEIPAAGQPFDPALHEAVAVEETDARPEGEIVEELQKGYRYGDEVLRPARVKVARRPQRVAGAS
jgi:molecular chaperone GrpE